jgi:Ribonuclease G/E
MDKHQLTIELEAWMHGAIASQAQELGCTETEVIQQALKLMLGMDEPSLSKIIDKKIDEKLKDFELQLEEKLAKRLQELSSDRPKLKTPSLPSPSLTGALQIGDLV